MQPLTGRRTLEASLVARVARCLAVMLPPMLAPMRHRRFTPPGVPAMRVDLAAELLLPILPPPRGAHTASAALA